jgi:ABC-type glycerol-3-phosphate transport system substrate-binding protein
MKIKLLIVTCLVSLTLGFIACGGGANTNNAAATATPTPITKTTETATTDPALKSKIEDALKKKGYTDVTVDTSTTPATIRGTVPKGKLQDAHQTAMEAAGKPINNQLTEK